MEYGVYVNVLAGVWFGGCVVFRGGGTLTVNVGHPASPQEHTIEEFLAPNQRQFFDPLLSPIFESTVFLGLQSEGTISCRRSPIQYNSPLYTDPPQNSWRR
ncbi:hypothetical protein O988_08903 [Pseudogymnoascus sp. VKM F-3808]|nr:hypothetical protein O988_08903 [Pseudogymnoascus sp. VKM F-3808]